MLLAGNEKEAKRKLARMEAEVADHPWLREKLAQLRELTERDAAMSAKELRYSGRSMSRRLTALDEPMFLMEETQRLDIPAYLRRKGADGRGRSKPRHPDTSRPDVSPDNGRCSNRRRHCTNHQDAV